MQVFVRCGLQHSALAGDGLDKVCMERGTLQNLYDYAVENMARVKNKTVVATSICQVNSNVKMSG